MKKKILAVFLSLCMAMSLLPVTALAAGEDTPSTQAAPALPGAKDDVITLTQDVELYSQVTISDNNVTIDGNGHTISIANSVNWATDNSSKYMLLITGNNVTIKNVTINAENNASGCVQFYGATGGKIEGNVTLQGANQLGLMVNASTVTATGTLTYLGNGWGNAINVGWGSNVPNAPESCSFDASGAKFPVSVPVYTDDTDVANAGEKNIAIEAPKGYENSWDVDEKAVFSAPVAAKIGDTNYYSLSMAVADAEKAGGATIELMEGCGETIEIDAGKNITFDLGSGEVQLYRVNLSKGTLTVQNGIVTGAQPFNVFGAETDEENNSVLNIAASATIKDATYGICVFGYQSSTNKIGYGSVINLEGKIDSSNDAVGIFISGNLGAGDDEGSKLANAENPCTVNIKSGGSINVLSQGIAMNGQAVVNVEDRASITGSEAIGIKRGVLNVTGGTFTATGDAVQDPVTANNNGTEDTGAAISVTSTYNRYGTIEINITGGEFTSQNNSAVYVGHSGPKGNQNAYVKGFDINISGGTYTTTATGGNIPVVYVAEKIENSAEKYTQKIISGGTFTGGAALDKDYLKEGCEVTENGQVVPASGSVASVNGQGFKTLSEAVTAAEDGDTIVLLADITNKNVATTTSSPTVLTFDKSVTIQGNGNEISIDLSVLDTFGDRDQVFSIGADEDKDSKVAVTFDNVKMTVAGKEDGKGDAFDVWGMLNITNGSNITVKDAQSAFTMQGGENAKVNIEASTVTANNIHGNFSNGGIWTIKEESILDINTAGNHGLSVEELTVNNSTVSVDGAAYTGILAAKVTLEKDANVTVTNCGKDLPQKSQWAPDKVSYKNAMELKGETPTLTVDNSTLTLTNNVNKDGTAINSIYLGKGTLTQQNNPTINVDKIVTSDEATTQYYVVTYMSNGEKWDSEVVNTGSVTLPEIPDQGYNHFQGWTDQAGNRYNGGQTVKIEKDTTFTAVWSYIPPANPNYKITIGDMENGTVTANPTAAKAGATVTLTPVPDEGYALSTLTVTDRFGNAVRVTEQADGTYTFTMPNGQVTVTATFVETEEPVDEPFVDVAEGDWFYDAVVYAYQNELMDGVGGNRFAPNSETTRAQLVTILYRLEGEPAVSGDLPFTDVEAGIWYTDAILWAAQNNIVNGVNDTEFAPGDDLTRQQLVTILYRYAEAKGYDVSASADLSGYPDAGQVQDYAQPAMAWAVAENIIQGMEDGTLKPAGNASRAQIATILMRFCEDVAQ